MKKKNPKPSSFRDDHSCFFYIVLRNEYQASTGVPQTLTVFLLLLQNPTAEHFKVSDG